MIGLVRMSGIAVLSTWWKAILPSPSTEELYFGLERCLPVMIIGNDNPICVDTLQRADLPGRQAGLLYPNFFFNFFSSRVM